MSSGQTTIARRILVAEDDGMIAEAICDRLTHAGYEVVSRPDTGAGAVEAALTLRPDLVLMDVKLKGDLDGIRASELINQRMRVPVVYLTGDSDQKTLERAKSASAYGYVLKPFHIRNLIVAIEVALDRFEMERRLEDSRLTYATILGSISDGVIAADTQGRVRFMNAVAERLTGWSNREAEGEPVRTVLRVTGTRGDASALDLISRVLASKTSAAFGRDTFAVDRAGLRVPVDGNVSCIVDGLGRVVGASIAMRDVTHARKAESDLRAVAEQLRVVVDTAVDGVLMFDASGTLLMVNPACERLFGYTSLELTGSNIDVLMASPLPAANGSRRPGSPHHRPIVIMERATICHRRDRSTFPAEVSVGEVRSPDHPSFVGVIHDITERRELETAYLEAVEREQRRFGTDLHDGLGQELTGLSLLLSALIRTEREAHGPRTADLERANEVARHALESCQAIARGLSPIGPTEGGLIRALRDLVARLKAPSGPRVEILVSEVSRLGLSPAATDHLYRIAQEALSNALRHAHAHSIQVSLDVEREHVRLEIRDDGEGVADSGSKSPGLGLRTMRYRASLIGARLEIAHFAPRGTRIVCDCPQSA
jgi:two-component system, LuxR family, sensor kinase FixL